MNVLNENENKLLDRTEVVAEFDTPTGTISRSQVLQELKKKYSGEIVLVKITQKFGENKSTAEARVYSDAEKAKIAEPEWRFKRGMPKDTGKAQKA
ncbi:TPA: hypothetical protein HA244_02300 [Candidatus Micrarchaeota archaeon]|nr:hypothetical protein [Candidatus Micrarchaeota archaeon]